MTVRQLKWVFLLAVLVTATACSFKTYYNRMDVLLAEYVEGKVTLDNVLEQKLEQRTEFFHDWHRRTQLKDYAVWLQGVQQDVGPHTTEFIVDQRTDEIVQFWNAIEARLNDEMAELLPMLDAKQQHELFINIEKDNESYRDENSKLTAKRRIKEYEKNLRDNYENWIGGLTKPQGRLVRQAASKLVSSSEERLQHRHEWQGGIRDILAANTSYQQKVKRLRAFLNGFAGSRKSILQQKSDLNRRIIVRLTVDIAHSLTPKQKAFFQTKTDDYIRMFAELSQNR